MKNFGLKLKLRRIEAGLNQTELGKYFGVAWGEISRWENDWHKPTPAHRKAIDLFLTVGPETIKTLGKIIKRE